MDPTRRVTVGVFLVSASLLSWFAAADVGALDAGELGGAAFTLGVPHPSGFSLDMLLLRASAVLPFGSLAFRQNLCVSWIAAAAISCVAYAGMRLVRQCGWTSTPALVACASASAAGLLSSRTVLDAALSVEVYATSLLCAALAGCLADSERSSERRALWPLAGLALGAHITAPLLIAPLLLAAVLRARVRRSWLLALCTALIVSYVPLASLRDTAFDWGDPQTFGRWLRHLSAARIREAYADALFTPDSTPRVRLLEQLGEQPALLLLAAGGAVALALRQRQRALMLDVLLCCDLAYATWINPMGVAQRQVGHASTALIGLFAGCGSACIVERLGSLRLQLGYAAVGAGLLVAGVAVSQSGWSDGYAVSERYGAASPLNELPPHAVYMCETDSSCANALFSLYAEGTRPDLDVVPAQHLWEPTVVRRLRGLPLAAATDVERWPPPEQRGDLAATRMQQLIAQGQLRPLYVERLDRLSGDIGPGDVALDHVPLIGLGASTTGAMYTLADLEHARFGRAGPSSELARELWTSAHDALGGLYLREGQDELAVAEYRRAATLTPLRAAAVSNLGVALEHRGDLHAALQETTRAVELDPSRATPWVNLARLLLRVHGPEAARAALLDASRLAVRDPRLDQLSQTLERAQGTTR